MRQIHMVAILAVLLVIYIASWHFLPKAELALVVVDKTVPEPVDYREHRALYWLSRHWRLTDDSGRFRGHERDYIGYHPVTDTRELLEEEHLEGARLLYLADTYGIYDYEKGLIDYELRLPYEHMPINLIFGGFNEDEAVVIREFARRSDVYVVGEHNIFGSPTYGEASEIIQATFGVRYDGWLVRYYESLEDVAFWMKRLYERIYGVPLELTGPGIAMVREGGHRTAGWYEDLIIFTADDMTEQYPYITSVNHSLLKGAARKVPYLYWMEVLEPRAGAEVLAYYHLPLTDEATEKLRIRGLGTRIPAMVYSQVPSEGNRVYFAGDFVDQLPAFLPSSLLGSVRIQRLITYLPGLPPHYQFYFRWYAPVMQNIKNRVVTR